MLFIIISIEIKFTQSQQQDILIIRKTCGNELNQRVSQICIDFGGINGLEMDNNRRVKRGIVEDCCHNRCHDIFIRRYYCKNSNRHYLA